MTEATEAVEACIEVPAQGKVEMNFTLEPTGADQKWILKDDNGDEWDTICVKFDGVKNGGVGKSGKAELTIQMVNTDLVFKKLSGNIDGISIYDVINEGNEGISNCKVDSQNAQELKMVLKANKQTSSGFSFKWVGQDQSGETVYSADPDARLEPL
ncbi:hypothetical protein [Microbulbifer hydrolyticus]|uniref:Uncharacterized protein n=1 Tax=Microbulbifer hydrolyticus TaxID=48074 RepID=A0A6P1T5T1_9GAMM|nr:hypothetical protein [Microbulbifer hydrolyticus]MBB5211005.1 hypothetical protein [Microbulbifer hydrolyticus]QHQ38184.1 hypothetical protein GTQ55_03720 [Microbulbifer hydrolyticus]